MTSTLILYTIEEIFETYPHIQRRGWTEEHLKLWLQQDIIAGVVSDDLTQLRIERDSFEDFITYHNAFLKKRIKNMDEQIKNISKN
jgi:hypothetical protein